MSCIVLYSIQNLNGGSKKLLRIKIFKVAAGIGTGAQMHQPLAIAVIGGFIIALPLLLIVLPNFLKLINIQNK